MWVDLDNAIKAALIGAAATIVAAFIPIAFAEHWVNVSTPASSSSPTPVISSPVQPSASVHLPSRPPKARRPENTWVAQLASVPISAGNAQLQQALSEVRSEVPGATYLDSSNYASLNPGYWMIYYAGQFSNGDQALAYCSAHGRVTREQCVGRFVSHTYTDRIYICFPPAGSQTSDCSHR
jgi:eukaryotic-like serine/threonine-protein kinase